MSSIPLNPAYTPNTASSIGVEEGYFLGCITQCAIVFSGYVMGKCYGILPNTREAHLVYWLCMFSVLHGASIAIGVFSTNLVCSLVPIYDSNAYVAKHFPGLQKLGGYSWTFTGITADYMVAFLTFKKLLFVVMNNKLITFDIKKQWYVAHIGALLFALPGLIQTIWVYFALVQTVPGVKYDDFIGKYLVTARLFLIKGTDIIFVVEIVQYAKKFEFDKTKIMQKIPRTMESCLYYVLSTGLVFYYLASANSQVARLLRNLTAKSTEVSTFLYLYYATVKEMKEQVVSGRTSRGATSTKPQVKGELGVSIMTNENYATVKEMNEQAVPGRTSRGATATKIMTDEK
jgi:hypothetical protein